MTSNGIATEPYEAVGNEEAVLTMAFQRRRAVMLTGPTGCGKTTLVQHMARRLGRPLVTVTCHEDLTTADLVGRHLVRGGDVTWEDGPLTRAVRDGAVCYLDEVIEARRDSLAILHSLSDHRRTLYLERTGEVLEAPAGFMLVASYNPRTRGAFKELKASFRQRFVTLALDYLPPAQEQVVVARESGCSDELAARLVRLAGMLRSARTAGESPSTRLLVGTAELIAEGMDPDEAIYAALLAPLSPDGVVEGPVREMVAAVGFSR